MKKIVVILSLFLLASCNIICQIEKTTEVIEENRRTIVDSTQVISANAAAVAESSEYIKQNEDLIAELESRHQR